MSVQKTPTVLSVSFLERIIQKEKLTQVSLRGLTGTGIIQLDDDHTRNNFIQIFRQTIPLINPETSNFTIPYYIGVKAFKDEKLKIQATWKMMSIRKLYGEYEKPLTMSLHAQADDGRAVYQFE